MSASNGASKHRDPPGERRSWIVSAALFAPLVLLVVVTVRTWRAEARYAAVTSNVVHDYAGVAAWQYSRRASKALHDEAMAAFEGIAAGHVRSAATASIEPPQAILDGRGRGTAVLLDSARFTFTYDARTRVLSTAGGIVGDETRGMLLRRLARMEDGGRNDDEPHRVLFDSADAAQHAIAIWTIPGHDQPLRAVYGVVADPRVLRNSLTQAIIDANLLPGTNASDRLERTDVAVRLARPRGAVVFATSQPIGATAATDTTGLQDGELHATVDFSARLADALIIGGAAPSQLPSLALMIVLAAALAAVGLAQDRRSRDLARVRSRFVANVSHELRTPLAQISMFAETMALRRERSASEGREFAAIIFAEARRLSNLVDSVLRFSRLESGHSTLQQQALDVTAEVAAAIEAFAPIAAGKTPVQLHGDGECYARLDRSAFRQVVLNLLDNAVKHGGAGRPVSVSVQRTDEEIQVAVEDSGPGVPPEWRERVFEPFIRVKNTGAPGAGIGLAVVRELVTAHQGRARIEQSQRGGARFVVTVPAAAAPAAPASPEPAASGV